MDEQKYNPASSDVTPELKQAAAEFLQQPGRAVFASAPGRADVMGGISDYAGGLVLEKTIGLRTYAAVSPRSDRLVRVLSIGDYAPAQNIFQSELENWLPGDGSRPRFPKRGNERERWASYVLGVVTSLATHVPKSRWDAGWDVVVHGQVPPGAGVSSSASIEIASLLAFVRARQLSVDGMRAAKIAQWAENHVAGAPCGIMDQVTSALGQDGKLLALLCRPHEILGQWALPPGAAVSCLNSNVKHSVGGTRYSAARVGAFMGLQLIRQIAGRDVPYLCSLAPLQFRSHFRDALPVRMSGREFLERCSSYPDPVSEVQPEQYYAVRSATSHPIYERKRAERFLLGLQAAAAQPGNADRWLTRAGKEMYGSHWSYTNRVGLGSPETSLLVRLVRERGPSQGLFGARISGGGAGGSVVVLHRESAANLLLEIASEYRQRTGLPADIVGGSSPGAWAS